MMQAILDVLEEASISCSLPVGDVLEVGSRNINGTVRTVFQHKATTYTGVDIESGLCVDLILDGCNLSSLFAPSSFDTVICCETLEHTIKPWIVVEEMKKVLKLQGFLIVSTPTFGFPEHRFPLDCYRFGTDAYKEWLFSDFELLVLKEVRDELNQPALVGIGRKI